MRWGHRFKDRQALERYQVKALAAYREFLQQGMLILNQAFQQITKVVKAFMMEHSMSSTLRDWIEMSC